MLWGLSYRYSGNILLSNDQSVIFCTKRWGKYVNVQFEVLVQGKEDGIVCNSTETFCKTMQKG